MMSEDTVKITFELTKGLYERFVKVLEEGQTVNTVLLELVRKYVSEKEIAESTYSEEEEEEIRKRLKDLGYIE